MNILVVYSHPRPRDESFSGAVLSQFVAGAEHAGHSCEVADLYREGFNPVMGERDLQVFQSSQPPEDVLKEQLRIERADGLCCIFPIWWYGMPAMLKGWFDRVWTPGWAYEWVEQTSGSLLEPRPCTFIMPIGSNKARLEKWGYDKHLDNIWRNGVLDFCGVDPIDVHFLMDTDGFNRDPFSKHLERVYQIGAQFGGNSHPVSNEM